MVRGLAPELRRVFEENEVSAPAHFAAESTSALLKYVRAGHLDAEQALHDLGLILALPIHLVSGAGLAAASLRTAIETGLTAYDAGYLALARLRAATLYTADRDLAAAHRRSVLIA